MKTLLSRAYRMVVFPQLQHALSRPSARFLMFSLLYSLFSSPHPHLSSASHLVLFSPERAQSLLSSVSLPRAPSCERQNQGTALQVQGKPLIVPLGCGAWCPSLRGLECLWSRLSRSVLL